MYIIFHVSNPLVGTFFKTAWTRFHRLKKSRFTHAVILSKASELPTAEFKTAAASLPGPPPAKTKRKSFSDLGARMKKERNNIKLAFKCHIYP